MCGGRSGVFGRDVVRLCSGDVLMDVDKRAKNRPWGEEGVVRSGEGLRVLGEQVYAASGGRKLGRGAGAGSVESEGTWS